MALTKDENTALAIGSAGITAPLQAALGGWGAGKTSRQQQGFYAEPIGNELVDPILDEINRSAGAGTFNEGQLNKAISGYESLKNQLSQGKISQADFTKATSSFIPQLTEYGQRMANAGSAGANAVRSQLGKLLEFNKETEIYKAGQEFLGRDLTPQEIAQFKPRFADNVDTGRAYLAEFAQQEAKSPQALAKKAPQYSGQVNKTFQDLLSRGATQEEADYFGRLLATGQVTPYEVNQFVQQLPEYQNIQDKAFRGGLEGELAEYDEKAFGRERENILSQYTRAGLQNSSALDFAITDALGKVQEQRGQFLAGLSSQQYGGNKAAARGDYEAQRNRYFEGQDYNRNRSDAYLDYLTQRADQGSDYTRQRDDYMNFLANQPKQKGPGALEYAAGFGQAALPFAYLLK